MILDGKKKRIYLSESFDPENKLHVKRLLKTLAQNPPVDFSTAHQWYELFCESSIAIQERQSFLELQLNLDKKNKEHEMILNQFESNIISQIMNSRELLMDIYLKSPFRYAMHADDRGILLKDILNKKRFTNKDQLILQLEESKIVRDYKSFSANAQVQFNNNQYLLTSLVNKMNGLNTEERKKSFYTYWNFIYKNEDIYNDMFDSLLKNRRKQAEIVGAKNYIELCFSELSRLDYGEKECTELRDSIYKIITPVMCKISETQKKSLETDLLFAHDAHIWPDIMPKKLPVNGDFNAMIKAVERIMYKISPAFGTLFVHMQKNKHIDIHPSPIKGPGAFCITFPESGESFIFGNFSCSLKDTMTLIHEFGHAIHGYATSNIKNILLRLPGYEFCEFASTALELLSTKFFQELWGNEEDSKRASSYVIFNTLNFFPLMAMIDEWQHLVYGATYFMDRQERKELWYNLSKKYRPYLSWNEYPQFEALGWLSRPHIFSSPFYFIDYGIAQLGSLQLWHASKNDFSNAIQRYIEALCIGGQRTLPELFKVAGLQLDFSENAISKIFQGLF